MTLPAPDGAEGRNEARRREAAGDRSIENLPNGRGGAQKSGLAERHGGEENADRDGNDLRKR